MQFKISDIIKVSFPDFTLRSYLDVLTAAEGAGYILRPVRDSFAGNLKDPFVLLRHDVDRQPENALKMALAEHNRGIRASYYFRTVPVSFDVNIITKIHLMGHEVGYHYEDWYLSKYDKVKAIESFNSNLNRLRKIAPIDTICMHGSPLAKEGNMTLWDHYDLRDFGVKDCILSHDYSDFAFFTDSGRTFGVTRANLRDELGNAKLFPDVRTSADVADFLRNKRNPKIMLSCHPERWSSRPLGWATQFAKDRAVNTVKRGIRLIRGTSS